MSTEITKVAVGVIIWKGDKTLIIKRKGSDGEGEYAFLGGHLEYMESFEECIRREVMEETNIVVKDIKFLNVSNNIFYNKHYILLGFQAKWESGEATIMEPNKCDYIGWHDINAIPKPIYKPSEVMINAYMEGKFYNDKK